MVIGIPWLLGAGVALARLRQLPELPPAVRSGAAPALTLCIPARDEAGAIGPALDSWLALPGSFRILVVDDGSSDATPALLAQRAAAWPGRLRVLRNEHLPAGWLGKNHALDLAARQPEALAAEWLLFVDGDVLAASDLLIRSWAFLAAHPADLLTLLPALDTVGWAERIFLPWATLGFLWAIPFARVPIPGDPAHCGVGAFILVRRAAYDAVGGHAGAPLAVLDDMGLARRVKAAGYRNRVALAGPGLHLRMYRGLPDLLRGMRKNALALPVPAALVAPALLAVLVACLGPIALVGFGRPWAGLAIWGLVGGVQALVQRRFTGRRLDPAWGLWPLAGPLLVWGAVLAAVDRVRGVNRWRGREVPL